MSYILDALKKSEQERGHGNIPSVQTVHTSSLNYHNKKTLWPYVLIAAVILNLIAIVYFYLDKDRLTANTMTTSEVSNNLQESTQKADDNRFIKNGTEQALTVTPAATPSAETTATIPQKNNRLNSEVIATERSIPVPTTIIDNSTESFDQIPTAKNSTVEDDTDVIDFHDLPDSIKQQLPSIDVSAHIYSSNPLQRSIVINNSFLEEGEYILDDLVLQKITPDGAILYYQGTRFNYPVVSGWQ